MSLNNIIIFLRYSFCTHNTFNFIEYNCCHGHHDTMHLPIDLNGRIHLSSP